MAEIKVNRETAQESSTERNHPSQRALDRPRRWPEGDRPRDPYLWPFGRSSDLSPFALMRRISDEMERTFGTPWSRFGSSETSMWSPDMEVFERDGRLVVHTDLPGVSKDDVNIEVANGELIIRGERKQEREDTRGGIHRSERSYGSFCRSISLPEGANLDQARAQFNNGVLEVSIPIPEDQRARQIPIGSEPTERKLVGSEGAEVSGRSKTG